MFLKPDVRMYNKEIYVTKHNNNSIHPENNRRRADNKYNKYTAVKYAADFQRAEEKQQRRRGIQYRKKNEEDRAVVNVTEILETGRRDRFCRLTGHRQSAANVVDN